VPRTRRALISTVQFEAELRSGALRLVDLVQVAQRLGVDGVEFRDVYWTDKANEIAAVRGATSEAGLIATYATLVTLFDASENRDQLRQAVDDAVALGSPLLRIFPGQRPAAEDQSAWRAAADAIDDAARHGVVIALENFQKAPGCHLAEVSSILDRVPSSALGTNLDIGNYALNGEDLSNAIRTLGARIVSTHLKDVKDTPHGPVSTYLGDGNLPLPTLLADLDRLPGQILYCFEFGGGGDPEGRIRKSLELLSASARLASTKSTGGSTESGTTSSSSSS